MNPKDISKNKWDNMLGDKFGLEPFRVMGIVEKYVVMRRKGCAPTLAHISDFGKDKEFNQV